MGEETVIVKAIRRAQAECAQPSKWERVAAGVHVRIICTLLVCAGIATFAWPILRGDGVPDWKVMLMSGALVLLGYAGIAPRSLRVFGETVRQLLTGWRGKGGDGAGT